MLCYIICVIDLTEILKEVSFMANRRGKLKTGFASERYDPEKARQARQKGGRNSHKNDGNRDEETV